MKEHPRARSHITLNEFQYVNGLKAILKGQALERKYYENLLHDEDRPDMQKEYYKCIDELTKEITETLIELYRYNKAQRNSDAYHQRRKLNR